MVRTNTMDYCDLIADGLPLTAVPVVNTALCPVAPMVSAADECPEGKIRVDKSSGGYKCKSDKSSKSDKSDKDDDEVSVASFAMTIDEGVCPEGQYPKPKGSGDDYSCKDIPVCKSDKVLVMNEKGKYKCESDKEAKEMSVSFSITSEMDDDVCPEGKVLVEKSSGDFTCKSEKTCKSSDSSCEN